MISKGKRVTNGSKDDPRLGMRGKERGRTDDWRQRRRSGGRMIQIVSTRGLQSSGGTLRGSWRLLWNPDRRVKPYTSGVKIRSVCSGDPASSLHTVPMTTRRARWGSWREAGSTRPFAQARLVRHKQLPGQNISGSPRCNIQCADASVTRYPVIIVVRGRKRRRIQDTPGDYCAYRIATA